MGAGAHRDGRRGCRGSVGRGRSGSRATTGGRRAAASSGSTPDRGAHELGEVVEPAELLGADLQVDLEARVTSLEHHIVVGDMEVVRAGKVEVIGFAAPEPAERLVEHLIAGKRGHVFEGQVREPQGRQDARQAHIHPHPPGRLGDPRHGFLQTLLGPGQQVAAQRQRFEVRLQVEAGDLGGERGIVELLQHLHRHRRRAVSVPDQEHLLLHPDAIDVLFDPPRLDHGVQLPQVGEQPFLEASQFLARNRARVQTPHDDGDSTNAEARRHAGGGRGRRRVRRSGGRRGSAGQAAAATSTILPSKRWMARAARSA